MGLRSLHFCAGIAALASALIPAVASAQTDVSASIYGAFSDTTTSTGVVQSPANQAGGIIELRHTFDRRSLFGFEAAYSFNRADQTYASRPTGCPAFGCTYQRLSAPANAHEITADWVPSLHFGNLRPFALLGAGLLLTVPPNSQDQLYETFPCGGPNGSGPCPGPPHTVIIPVGTQNTYKPVYVYGAGLDWGLLPHMGLRLQYRGNIYQPPNVTGEFPTITSYTHTAEPMVGAYFRF